MTDTEESPAQRSARIRREKREAKIKSGGQDRLDKITKLSGRTPETMRNESPVATPPRTASPAVPPPPPPTTEVNDPEILRQQEEFLKAMLRSQPATSQTQQQQQQQAGQTFDAEDPMMKMLSSMLGGMNGDPNAAGDLPSLNPDDIAKATGLPSFVTNMMIGKQKTPMAPSEVKAIQRWKSFHLLFAVVASMYMLFTVNNLTSTFGDDPPAPATAQNPFVIFVMGELLLHGSRGFLSSPPTKTGFGFGFWMKTAKDIARDGAIMVFILGMYNWWRGSTNR